MASKDKRENGSTMDDAEFEKLLDEMDELGRQADFLREKVNHLIEEMRENDVVVDEETDSETGDEDGNPESSVEEDSERKAVDDSENPHPEGLSDAGTTR